MASDSSPRNNGITSKCYENYPVSTVVQSVLAALALYTCGALVLSRVGGLWYLLYLVYIFVLEVKVLRNSCAHCFYYGKFCAFGRGKICRLLFKQGNPRKFADTGVTWVTILPDLLVSLVPILAGIILIGIDFEWELLAYILLIVFLASAGNGYIRGRLACRYCKQREIVCPATAFFSPNKKQDGKDLANSV